MQALYLIFLICRPHAVAMCVNLVLQRGTFNRAGFFIEMHLERLHKAKHLVLIHVV
jgi:hypothetical protein